MHHGDVLACSKAGEGNSIGFRIPFDVIMAPWSGKDPDSDAQEGSGTGGGTGGGSVGGGASSSRSDSRTVSPRASAMGATRNPSIVRRATAAAVAAAAAAADVHTMGGRSRSATAGRDSRDVPIAGGGPALDVARGDQAIVGGGSPQLSAHGSDLDVSRRDGPTAFQPKSPLSPLMASDHDRSHGSSGVNQIGRISECTSEAERDGDPGAHYTSTDMRRSSDVAASLQDQREADQTHAIRALGEDRDREQSVAGLEGGGGLGRASPLPARTLPAPAASAATPVATSEASASAAAEASAAAVAAAATAPPSRPMRCLVVDDTASNAKMLKMLLMKKKFAVDVRENGQEGVDAVRESLQKEKETGGVFYDLICIDYTMPVRPTATMPSRHTRPHIHHSHGSPTRS